jgi:hypothetical protein
VPPRAHKVRHAFDQDKPADNHQPVRDPVASCHCVRGGCHVATAGGAAYCLGVEVVCVRVAGYAAVEARAGDVVAAAAGVEDGGAEAEAELDECDTEASAGSVLGGVSGVQKIGEEEADKLEGHGYHGVPYEAEERADGEALDKDFVAEGTGSEDGGFPVRRCCVGSSLFVCLYER